MDTEEAPASPQGNSPIRHGLREAALVVTAVLMYSLVRGLTDDRVELAFENAHRLISFESALGLFVEPDLQSLITGNEAAINAANAIYIGGYWPVLVGTLLWLLFRHPRDYQLYRNALLVSGGLTLVIFSLFPLAPPRFLPGHGFVDTVSEHSAAYRDFSASPFVNEYAAMPSLHFGWILLMGIAWATVGRTTLARITGVAMPTAMFATIVLTGNHYIMDGLVGGIVVLAGLVVAHGVKRWTKSRDHTGSVTSIPAPRAETDTPLVGASTGLGSSRDTVSLPS